MSEKEELIELLAWAFSQAEGWLWDSRGCQYSPLDFADPEAEKIRNVLKEHGKYIPLFEEK